MSTDPFWRTKKLAEMSRTEWESLCDGCGKCCLLKLQDEDSGEIFHTDVACKLLNLDSCRCSRYKDRQKLVPDCVKLSPENVGSLDFMPSSCAYRLWPRARTCPGGTRSSRGGVIRSTSPATRSANRVISEDDIEEDALPGGMVDWPR